jgi:hypothetical protein
MDNDVIFGYNTATLESQREAILKSQLDARIGIIFKAYGKVARLDKSDPSELWRFAIGNSARPENLTSNPRAVIIADRLRQFDPQFGGDPGTYERFRDSLGKPTLGETVLNLASRCQDDTVLARHLPKLLRIYKRGPISQDQYQAAAADTDNTTRLLLMNWIEDPASERFLIHSLCFYSDIALAKFVYFLAHDRRKALPTTLLTTEPERIRKLYRNLGLIPAKPRAIKDVECNSRAEEVRFIPYKKTIIKRG